MAERAPKMLRCRPERLEFCEFRVGKLYSQILQIDGVAEGYKLGIRVAPSCQACLDVQCMEEPRQGIVRFRVIFTPQLNEDMKGSIQIAYRDCSNGTVMEQHNIQVIMRRRSLVFTCLTPIINFGEIIISERCLRQISFHIEGVDHVNVQFESQDGIRLTSGALPAKLHTLIEQLKFSHKTKLEVENGKAEIPIEYVPTSSSTLLLKLQARLKGYLEVPVVPITLTGSCIDLPIVPLTRRTNMNICILGHSYKATLKFENRNSCTSKVQIIQPPETRRLFEFNPMLGFINQHSTFEVQLLLKVEKDLQVQLAKYLTSDKGSKQDTLQQSYEVPFKLVAAAQQSPIDFSIAFCVTSDRLTIEPSSIDFGKVYSGTSSKCEVVLRNCSVLEQEVLLLHHSKNLIVEAQQPIRIMPEESRVVRLLYRNSHRNKTDSKPEIEQSFIKCKIVTGAISANELKLNYSCTRMYPILRLSHNKIQLPVIQIDEAICAIIHLTNQSDLPLVFEIFVPYFELCGLQITPLVKTLVPRETIELCLEYSSFFKTASSQLLRSLQEKYSQTAPISYVTDSRKRNRKTSSNVEETLSVSEQLAKLGGKYTALPQGEHYEWLVPIYFKQKDLPDASAEVTYLEISTVSIEKTLLLDTQIIDFGDVPVGGSEVRQLFLTNLDPASDITKSDLHSFSGFEIINSLKRMEQNEECALVVRFEPMEEIGFEQKLTLHSDRSLVSCVLRGNGIRPDVTIEPLEGQLDMGNIMAGQSTAKTLRINNNSQFPTHFKLQRSEEGDRCSNGLNPIVFIPTQGTVEPDQSTEVQVLFQPSSPSCNYFTVANVHIQEQRITQSMRVHGRCHPTQVYLFEQSQPLTDLRSRPTNRFNVPIKTLVLSEGDFSICSVKKVVLGCCQAEPQSAQVQRYWRFRPFKTNQLVVECKPSDGELFPGQQTLLEIKFSRPVQPVSIASIDILKGIGEHHKVSMHLEITSTPIDTREAPTTEVRQIILRVYSSQI